MPSCCLRKRLAPKMCSRSPPVTLAACSAGLGKPFPGPPTLLAPRAFSICLKSLQARQGKFLPLAVSGQHVFSASHKSRLVPSRAMNMFSGETDGSEKLNLEMVIVTQRKLWGSCPSPLMSFPWKRTAIKFFQLLLDLLITVVKYLYMPVLGLSSLSEMSYCAHERKILLVPIPFLAGIAVGKILKETAVKLYPSFKETECPCHLLMVATFFILLKLPGPHYLYWGRLLIPHFANGGLWSTLWYVFSWYSRFAKVKEMFKGENLQS